MKKLAIRIMIVALLINLLFMITSCDRSGQNDEGEITAVDAENITDDKTSNESNDMSTSKNIETENGEAESNLSNKINKSGKLFPVFQGDGDEKKWGYIDAEGNLIIDFDYDIVYEFNSSEIGVAGKVSENNDEEYASYSYTYDILDSNGKIVAGPFISNNVVIEDGLAFINTEDGAVIISDKGEIINNIPYRVAGYSEGYVRICETHDSEASYGYIDMERNEIIKPQFRYAEDFIGNRAVVILDNALNAIIDKNGNILKTSEQRLKINSMDEGLEPYYDPDYDKYGYRTENETLRITPQFNQAGEFIDGVAIVDFGKEKYEPQMGLIDKQGKFIIEPQYTSMRYIGEGLYAVTQNSYSFNDEYSAKAIYNKNGKQLTDFIYYTLDEFKNGMAVASDDLKTFFISTNGQKLEGMPVFDGIGRATVYGDIIKADIDNMLMYVTKKGDVIWSENKEQNISETIIVVSKKYRPDFAMLIHYPEFKNLPDSDVQNDLNRKIKDIFIDGYDHSLKEDGNYNENYDISYSITRNKDIIILKRVGYYYPIGAAHGQPIMDYYHINIEHGIFYELSDLFKADSDFMLRINTIINKQIEQQNAEAEEPLYYEEQLPVPDYYNFVLHKDALEIYYVPYEIASYAAGFPSFKIPYDEIKDIIDTEGMLWNAFENAE